MKLHDTFRIVLQLLFYWMFENRAFKNLPFVIFLLFALPTQQWGFSSKRNLANLPPAWISSSGCDKDCGVKSPSKAQGTASEAISTVFVTSVHSISIHAAHTANENSSVTRNFTTTVVCDISGTSTAAAALTKTLKSVAEDACKTKSGASSATGSAAKAATTTHTHTTTSSVVLSKLCVTQVAGGKTSTSSVVADATAPSKCAKNCRTIENHHKKHCKKPSSEESSAEDTEDSDTSLLEYHDSLPHKHRLVTAKTKQNSFASHQIRHEPNSFAHIIVPYPYLPPKDCSFSFTRLIRVNLYYFIRNNLSRSIDVDDIKVSHCCFNSDNDETTVEADVEFRNAHRHLLSQLEISLDRIEPSSKEVKISKFQTCLIDQAAIADYAFHLIPMKNYELENAFLAVRVFRKFAGIVLAVACAVLAVFIYIQWNQLQRNTSNFYALSV